LGSARAAPSFPTLPSHTHARTQHAPHPRALLRPNLRRGISALRAVYSSTSPFASGSCSERSGSHEHLQEEGRPQRCGYSLLTLGFPFSRAGVGGSARSLGNFLRRSVWCSLLLSFDYSGRGSAVSAVRTPEARFSVDFCLRGPGGRRPGWG